MALRRLCKGGERAALLNSFIGTCQLNKMDPEVWLRHVISHIARWPANRVHELLPLESRSYCLATVNTA
ncbi:transposase domain-containing protein [Photorhabdus antumapuensis]|uniref:transposase domain-containing protein n=1 Tax=Photorhabdus antumapuensis TaxID=2862867 RepID=UPI0037CB464A